jgi:hypothetical protein
MSRLVVRMKDLFSGVVLFVTLELVRWKQQQQQTESRLIFGLWPPCLEMVRWTSRECVRHQTQGLY